FRGFDRKRIHLGRDLKAAMMKWAELIEMEPPKPLRKAGSGSFVYVVGPVGQEKHVKFGRASHLEKSVSALQTGHDKPLEVKAAYLFGGKSRAREIGLLAHHRFRSAWHRGEWFNIHAITVADWVEDQFIGEVLETRP